MNTQTIKLDINKRLYQRIIAKQGDTKSRFLLFHLLDGGIPFSLVNRTVRVYGLKPDNKEIFNDLKIVDAEKGHCELELTSQALAVPGDLDLELVIMEGESKLSTIPFTVYVEKSLNSRNAIESSNEYKALDEALIKTDKWNSEFADKSGKIEQLYTERLNGIDTQLADIVQQIPIQSIPNEKLKKIKNKVVIPKDFSWKDIPINIYRNGLGEISTDFNNELYKISGKTYYVAMNGNDNNDGLTKETALRSVATARKKADAKVIYVCEGFYDDQYSFDNNSSGVAGYKELSIIGETGKNVVLSTRRSVAWSKTSGKTNVYQATRTLMASIYDSSNIDANGDYTKFNQVNSIDLCDSTPNSYYYDNTTIYIHTFDNRVADDKILVFLNLINFKSMGDYNLYFENIKFYGGNSGSLDVSLSSITDKKVVAKNCEFKYSTGGNGGCQIVAYDSIMQNCITAKNFADGFNYHKGGLKETKSIEIDCVGRSNGIGRGTNTDNGSTTHEGGKIVRVNCRYHNNEGPNCHDVDINTESWNIGVECNNSVATIDARKTNYQIEGGKMFLDSCIGYDSTRALTVTSTGIVYIHNALFDDNEQYITGQIINY